jgi:predicted dehydrogenase
MSLRVAIVGCGRIADGHAESIRRTGGLGTLVAACDLEPVLAEQFAIRMGVPARYADFGHMLEAERPDVVHITTPPSSHLELTRRAMEAGAHVFCEKPLALTEGEARQMVDIAQRTGRKLTVGWEYFFDPPALLVRELVAKGVIGDPIHVESSFGYDHASAFGEALMKDPTYWVHRLPGKLFHNVIDHLLNKILEFVDDDEPRIAAEAFRGRREHVGDTRDDVLDELRLIIRGERVTGYGTFSADIRPVGHFLRLYGTRNTLHADFNKRTVVIEASPRFPSALGRLLPAFAEGFRYFRAGGRNLMEFAGNEFHYFQGMKTLLMKFYESIVTDGPPPIPYRDLIRMSAVLDEIFRQAPQGRERT